MRFLFTIVLVTVVGTVVSGIITVITNGHTLGYAEDQQRCTGAVISGIKERILYNNGFIPVLERNPEIRKLLHEYNLSIAGKRVWIEEITPQANDLYKVRLRIEITPILYMLVNVIVDSKLNVVEASGKPRFSLIPPAEVETELSKLSHIAKKFLSNVSNIKKLLNNPKIVTLLRSKGVNVDIKLLVENIRQQLSKGVGVEMSFDTRTGKFNGYILTLQLVKLRINGKEKWVPDDQYLLMIKNRGNTNIKCLEQLVMRIRYTIASNNTPEIKHIETLKLPVCLVQIRSHPSDTHKPSSNG